MTITTANWPVAKALRLTPLALAAMLLSNECRADWKVTPSMNLRETYSDNVNNQPDEGAASSFVTEAAPGVSVIGNSRRLKVDAGAEFRRYIYHSDLEGVRNSDRRYHASVKSELVDDFLFLDASASGQRQMVSAFGPTANSYSALNNTDVRTWSISPTVRHRFGSTATLVARFTRDSVESSLHSAFGDTLASTRALSLASGTAFNDLGWTLSYNHQDLSSKTGGDSSTETSTAGLRWRLNPRLSLTASAGYDNYEYPALAQRTSGRSWTGGFIWVPSSRTSVDASFGRRYFGKTGALMASHRTRHSTWSLSYSDAITTTRSQFLLPATVDTASLLDRLFASAYPDPAQRQQIVQAYIAATGLPPALANSINYLSNRYIRYKRLQGAVAFRGARTDLLLSVFKDERNAVSLQQADSSLLPSQLSTLNDNTRQRGVSASAGYRLSSRTRAQASLYAARVLSLDTGITNPIRQASLGVNRRFDAKTTGSLDLRHSTGRFGVVNGDQYHENAIVATLSVQY